MLKEKSKQKIGSVVFPSVEVRVKTYKRGKELFFRSPTDGEETRVNEHTFVELGQSAGNQIQN